MVNVFNLVHLDSIFQTINLNALYAQDYAVLVLIRHIALAALRDSYCKKVVGNALIPAQ